MLNPQQNSNQQSVKVQIKGLTKDGFLKAINVSNQAIYELHPDGNSFYFFKVLIINKILS